MKILSILLLLASSALADTRTVSVEAGVGEIRIAAPAEADISWESRRPLDLRYLTHSLSSGESAIVFCASPGAKYVIVSDVIDWDARKRTKTTWLVTVGGEPDDPIIDPEDPDDPVVPPANVPDKYGIGPAVYAAAARLSDRSDAAGVAALMINAEQVLNQGRNTPRVVVQDLDGAIKSQYPAWRDVAGAFISSTNEAARKYGAGMTATKNYIREARLTVELLK